MNPNFPTADSARRSHFPAMVAYLPIYPIVARGHLFFTLTLGDRSAPTLVEQIDALRWSLRQAMRFRAVVPALADGENRATGIWSRSEATAHDAFGLCALRPQRGRDSRRPPAEIGIPHTWQPLGHPLFAIESKPASGSA